ncbi:MAG: hypothetical protein NC191_01495 [Muribaculaceae bacterium]|nr:hypothetical protein [Muribaculaceae bacterium]
MRKIVLSLLISLIVAGVYQPAQASIISDYGYRREQVREHKQDIKLIKELFRQHGIYANKHDSENLARFYDEKYVNNDGFDKQVYFKSIESTWEACEDLSYSTKILEISVNGDYADVEVEETATGTVREKFDYMQVSGEIHSVSTGIYHMKKVNGSWYIASETAIADESSLLYGDARFMNIDLQVPAQVSSGEEYTATLRLDADDDIFAVGSLDHDLVTYPTNPPKSELRPVPKSQILERVIKANTNNINEYAVGSLAISRIKPLEGNSVRVYMAGLACVMKRINVVPKNNFIKLED